MSAIIEFKDYTWQYLNTESQALKNVTMQVEEGIFLGVIGPNGAGKTTWAYSINGLIPGQYRGIKNGGVYVLGKEVEEYGRGQLQRMVGLVFSDPEAQFTAMTVEDELVFGMENLGMSIPEIRERLEWVVDLVKLESLLLKPPYEISGGQKQRVALAAVLAMTPQVMILDEPTSMLDPISRKRVFDVLAQLKRDQNNTIIVIEHSLENLIPLADRMLLLSEGGAVLEGETRSFFQNMEALIERGIYPPGVMRFFYELSRKGLYQGGFPLTVQEGYQQLAALFAAHRARAERGRE